MNANRNVPLTIAATAALVLAIIAGGVTWFSQQGAISNLEGDITTLEGQVNDYAAIAAFGGGVNAKFMPAEDGTLIHAMDEVFSFSTEYALCRVDTNFTDFVMPTYGLGEVPIPAKSFYMAMASNNIESHEISTNSDGSTQVVLTGTLDCFTEVVLPDATFGGRTAGEPATFRVTAIDSGMGGGGAGDTFAFTTFFDPDAAPLNHTIFGPEFTFTGAMTDGEITIRDIEPGTMN